MEKDFPKNTIAEYFRRQELLQNQIKSMTRPMHDFDQVGNDFQKQMKEIQRLKAVEREREEDYKQQVLDALLGIEKNTANIAQLVTLIQSNNDKQDEIIQLLKEVFEMGKAQNLEEAESKYRQIMRKISNFEGDVATLQSLTGFANTTFSALQNLF